MLIKNLKMFLNRNIKRTESYRLRSYFNLLNNKFDYFFAKNKIRKLIFKIMYRIIGIIKYCIHLKVNIHSIDYNLTTFCNLRCKNCASLMPYYDSNNGYMINFEMFKKDLDQLLLSVNKIYRLKLIGGEPLLVKDLEKMLDYACSKKQIISVIITTNGKLIPSDAICSVLKKHNKKALVELSDYSESILDLNYKKIEDKLKTYNIYYFVSNYPWFECGKIYKRDKSKEELVKSYKNCFQSSCLSFFDGKMYTCTRAAAVNRLTSFEFEPDSIVEIRKNKTSKEKIRKFYTKEYHNVCCFCAENGNKRVKRGVQTNETFKITL